MFTPREQAMRIYRGALSDSRWRAFGLKGWEREALAADRRRGIAEALKVVEAAYGTERMFLREPDDARLDVMTARLAAELESV